MYSSSPLPTYPRRCLYNGWVLHYLANVLRCLGDGEIQSVALIPCQNAPPTEQTQWEAAVDWAACHRYKTCTLRQSASLAACAVGSPAFVPLTRYSTGVGFV